MLSFLSLVYFLQVAACSLSSNSRTTSDLNPVSRNGPRIVIGPKQPFRPMPKSTSRTKTCEVKTKSDGRDDSKSILAAIGECNNGGRVIFAKEGRYTIGTALDLKALKHIDLVVQGSITFSNDTEYWQKASFKHGFQDASTYFQLGGTDVNVYGGGTIDGNGRAWADQSRKGSKVQRPILFGTIGMKGGTISDLTLRDSPQWFNFISESRDVVFSDIRMYGKLGNTDGWDTYRSTNIVIQNSYIDNRDDCVSFKPNSTGIVVQNLICKGSHGISVGSLGQYKGEVDIVEDLYITNISMSDASDGARIKVWPNVDSTMGQLSGGGGTGRVSNVVYENMRVSNVDYAVQITQCYGQKNHTLCRANPSGLEITNIIVRNLTGTTSKKYDPFVGSLVCSGPSVCKNITLSDINVLSPSGRKNFRCENVVGSDLAVACT